ncbi:hypothetical protein OB13_03950 [Pontibacter sp. HJ8]
MKLRYLLLALYEYKYNGKLYEIEAIFSTNGIAISRVEAQEIAKTLTEDGLIRTMSIGETLYSQITVDGVEYLEENNYFTGSTYLPQDRIKPLERELLRDKLDLLQAQLQESRLGKIVPAVTIAMEVEELKNLLNILGRHSWIQILKGKLFEMSAGYLSQVELHHALQMFEVHAASENQPVSDFTI